MGLVDVVTVYGTRKAALVGASAIKLKVCHVGSAQSEKRALESAHGRAMCTPESLRIVSAQLPC